MKNKKFIIFFLVTILTLSLVACGSNDNNEETSTNEEKTEISELENEDNLDIAEETEEDLGDDIEKGEEDEDNLEKDIEVNLYYANLEYIETGNEELDQLIPVKKTLTVSNDNLEKLVVEELSKNPEDESLTTLIRDDINIKDVFNDNGTAVVDFSSENLSGGSLEESIIIEQIVETLLELDTVEEVQFLVDGEITDSLMGHVSLESPFTK